jgi:hypothetical protein
MTKKEPPRNQKVYQRSTQHAPYEPQLPAASAAVVWERISMLIPEVADIEQPAEPPKQRKRGAARRRKRLKRKARILDVVGAVVWLGAITKLFIADLDRLLVSSVIPQAAWLLDFRVFAVLALIALLLVLFKMRTLGVALAYVAAYPLVIIFWKLPKFLIKRRSPLLVMGLAGIVTSLAVRARLFICALAVSCLSGLLITLSGEPWLIYVGMGALLLTLLWWMSVTAIDLLRAPRFISAQEKLIKSATGAKLLDGLLTPKHPDPISLKAWTAEEAKAYRDIAGNVVLARRIMHFWAHSLDEYRKGPSVVILNVLVVVGLLAQVIAAFSLLTYGAFVVDSNQFEFTVPPQWSTFVYYSSTGLYFGEIGALAPVAGLAIVVKLLNGLVGAVGVLTIIGSMLIAFRSIRSESSSVGAIRLLNKKVNDIEATSGSQFQLSSEELEEHLLAASWGLMGVANWFASKTPDR